MRIDRDKVKKQMRRKGLLRFGELAEIMGVNQNSVSSWFAGGPFSSVSLAALCRTLNCSPNDVLVWKEEESAPKSDTVSDLAGERA